MKVHLIGILLLLGSFVKANDLVQIPFIEVTNANEWQAAFDQAKTENKLVFVDAYTDWCSYCHKLDKEVYTDQSVVDYYSKNFINVKFDAESDFGYPKADQLNISGYPTLLFMTGQDQVFKVVDGFVPAEALLSYGKEISRMISRRPDLEAKFDANTITRDEHLEFIGILEGTDEVKASEVAKAYVKKLKEEDFLDLQNIWLLARHQNQLNGYPYLYISTHKDLLVEAHGINEYNDYMTAVYNDNLELAIKYGDDQLMNDIVLNVLPHFVENDQLPNARFSTRSVYYGQRGEFERYKIEVNSYMNNHLSNDSKADFALSTTYEIIENYASNDMIAFSTQLLKQALDIDEKNFELNSIIGYAKGLLGDYKDADKYIEIAKSLAEGEEELEIVQSLADAVQMMKEGQD
ncbi:thioredoxin family protein [Roseivirga sp. 4D4]|uniref:thioredoxin family protein n=1 Tax=Roseivirga sp. 4D4 TaxID=1889784 RepID=UPI00147D643A|nr:thioredoxin family protein [Roseivirga sp. 4D4]